MKTTNNLQIFVWGASLQTILQLYIFLKVLSQIQLINLIRTLWASILLWRRKTKVKVKLNQIWKKIEKNRFTCYLNRNGMKFKLVRETQPGQRRNYFSLNKTLSLSLYVYKSMQFLFIASSAVQQNINTNRNLNNFLADLFL